MTYSTKDSTIAVAEKKTEPMDRDWRFLDSEIAGAKAVKLIFTPRE